MMTESQQLKIFRNWIAGHQALIFKVVRAFAFTANDQEELFQEISIQVWHSIPSFQEKSSVSTWLYRIGLNSAIRWSAKEKKHRDGHQSIQGLEHVLKVPEAIPDERLNWLYAEIALLDEIDRSLTLLLLDGFSYKEMGELLGISESNIGVKLHRIKKRLSERSKKWNHDGI